MKSIFKKASCLIIAAMSAFCMVSCADTQETTTYNTFVFFEPGWSSCVLYPPGYNNGIKYEEVEYLTFEEMCAKVDCIVVVNYVDYTEYDDYYRKHTFYVKESILGDLSGEIEVYVKCEKNKNYRVMVNGKEHYFYEDSFGVNEITDDVMLFLALEENLPGFSSPQYIWHGAPFIDLTYLDYSSMYNDSISKHMTGLDFNNATREEVLAYIKSLVANRNAN